MERTPKEKTSVFGGRDENLTGSADLIQNLLPRTNLEQHPFVGELVDIAQLFQLQSFTRGCESQSSKHFLK